MADAPAGAAWPAGTPEQVSSSRTSQREMMSTPAAAPAGGGASAVSHWRVLQHEMRRRRAAEAAARDAATQEAALSLNLADIQEEIATLRKRNFRLEKETKKLKRSASGSKLPLSARSTRSAFSAFSGEVLQNVLYCHVPKTT